MFKDVIVTLYEGHYHFGVAALINSLHHSEFEGLLYIGYKGSLPPWIDQLEQVNANLYQLSSSKIHIEFDCLNVKMHFGYYKPFILSELLKKNSHFEKIYYFDPDIVVNAPWTFYLDWVEAGIALCLDSCFPYLHRNHPWRRQWKILNDMTLSICKIDYYVNSGFIGIKREDAKILDLWASQVVKYQEAGKNINKFEQSKGYYAYKGDQDLLNAAITIASGLNFSIIGTEGMGFTQPAYLMSHAAGDESKPWKKNYIKQLFISGQKPSTAEADYFKYCYVPIKLHLKNKEINLKIAKLFGRIL